MDVGAVKIERKSRQLGPGSQLILLEPLPAGSVITVDSKARITIARKDGRLPWMDCDPETGAICLTSRAKML